ncbi:GntR family transcriptional regulator [Rhodococcus sp. D2-41]|uniref:GntR family transcriptional regulator n=1 Tax=Speluncibacter jeojiensis TaxID=2710754 RepID=A0A9X4M495_9ACTN|nr:GntR family transcriptional regulator [Rhodococcus sp. D2-41]MDG3009342.1 GntR family transcriptional regulator [Rhodococcus sp. D2-41]MDG3016871.1 GntR family transcriptional regulator [Corynebacteriales bacterium D3-21]
MSKTYSAAEQVYRTVKEQILTGVLPGGELISEGEVAGQLGLSRTPVREAFLRLEAEGWMRLYPKRGALIVPVADGEAAHVVEARQLLEVHAAATVAGNAAVCEALVPTLRDNLERQRRIHAGGDLAEFSAADAEFHRLIVEAAGNPLLLDFYDALRDRQRRMTARSIARNPAQVEAIIADHAALADLVEAGDPAGFGHKVGEHMRVVHGLTGGRA